MGLEVERSHYPDAVYKEQLVPAYRGNRFIEALPEIATPEDEVAAMQRLVVVSNRERAAPSHVRVHMLETFTASFLQPLEQHIELSGRFSTMLRSGYLNRNPNSPEFLRKLGVTLDKFKNAPDGRQEKRYSKASGRGMALIGMSGVGKSRAIEAVLDSYPQVIYHPELSGPLRTTHQIVWIKLSCPTDGSIKAVCRRFFALVDELLGTNYHHLHAHNSTLEQMRDGMCAVASVHGLGALVIDEIQNLRRATGFNADALLRFFLILRDDLNVPVVVIGTETAVGVLGGTMQVARRHAGSPLFERMKFDGTFELLCQGMFAGQYLREPIEVTHGMLEVLYELSQGVTDILLKIFVLAQWRALALGEERLTVELFREVYDDCLVLLHKYVDHIRNGEAYDEAGYDDAVAGTGLSKLERLASSPTQVRPVQTARELATLRATRRRPANTTTCPEPRSAQRDPEGPDGGMLVRLTQCKNSGPEAYDALRAVGVIRDLGAEIIDESLHGA